MQQRHIRASLGKSQNLVAWEQEIRRLVEGFGAVQWVVCRAIVSTRTYHLFNIFLFAGQKSTSSHNASLGGGGSGEGGTGVCCRVKEDWDVRCSERKTHAVLEIINSKIPAWQRFSVQISL